MSPPPPSLSKTSAQSRRGAHHGVWWACTQQAICQHPRRPCQKPLESDRGAATHEPDLAAKCMLYCFCQGWWPCAQQAICWHPAVPVKKQYEVLAGLTSMTQDFGPTCTLYCFLTGMAGGGAHRVGCACFEFGGKVCFVLFFDRDGGGGSSLFRVGSRSPGGGGVY